MTMFAKIADRWLAFVALALLIVGCFAVLRPFLTAMVWAAILVYSSWPLLGWLEKWLGGRRTLATLAFTLLTIGVLVAPFLVVSVTLSDNASELRDLVLSLRAKGLPLPPAWLRELPMVGERAEAYWLLALHDEAWLATQIKEIQAPLGGALLKAGSLLGTGLLELSLSIFIAFFMFVHGEQLAVRLNAVFERMAGEKGVRLTRVAGDTVTGVVYGILGTALAQGVLGGIGFWIAGVPAPVLLGLAIFFLSVVPVGPPLVWGPAALWLYFQGETGWAVFLALWGTLVVSSVDNFLKPFLISRGASLPFILVLMGVMGGVVAFGFIGVFLGPTLLAVGYRLLQEWTAEAMIPAASHTAEHHGRKGH
ncbi:hypothetical protein OTERR_28160 [Oryzomicrobium terrae]|uniref:AI-2E family transporter n=1 Tax=Oryzomicrobium terrae TaxID=1735038 RepID=A0A5C1EBN1_9RHOO|nr:AI-2E family transporter [Oryzomicrobium terrae]QEL66292.1 hypothetical protein OTERR_28160 [Oryzomicrobium terrae]